jgi:hypothetical protein
MTTFSDDELQIDEESVEDLQPTGEETDAVGGGKANVVGGSGDCAPPTDHAETHI